MTDRYQTIQAHLIELLAQQLPAGTKIQPQTKLVDDLGLDSVQVMEVLMELEDRLDASIPMNALPEVQTVEELTRAMEKATA